MPAGTGDAAQATPTVPTAFSRKRRRPVPSAQEVPAQHEPLLASCGASGLRTQRPKPLAQTFLDVGQRDFHASTCATCGMLYAKGQPVDERLHRAFHDRAMRGVVYCPARRDRVVASDEHGAIVAVVGQELQRANRLQGLVDQLEASLGLAPGWLLHVPVEAFLHVAGNGRRITGCVVTEAITPQHTVGVCTSRASQPAQGSVNRTSFTSLGLPRCSGSAQASAVRPTACTPAAAPCASAPPVPSDGRAAAQQSGGTATGQQESSPLPQAPPAAPTVAIGIRLVWVSVGARRQRVASKLLDCARCQLNTGSLVPRAQLAFSQPTDCGIRFIQAYTGQQQFLVYSSS